MRCESNTEMPGYVSVPQPLLWINMTLRANSVVSAGFSCSLLKAGCGRHREYRVRFGREGLGYGSLGEIAVFEGGLCVYRLRCFFQRGAKFGAC